MTDKPNQGTALACDRVARDTRALTLNARARNLFEQRYQGAAIRLHTTLHHRAVIRCFTRYFAISMRNWHIATTVPRSALGDAQLATQVETGMLRKVGAALAHFGQRLTQSEELARRAELDLSLICHGHSYDEETAVLGPVAMQVRQLFLLCDRFLDLSSALYSFGQISGDEANADLLEVKRRLQGVVTSIRNQRRLALSEVGERSRASVTASPGPG